MPYLGNTAGNRFVASKSASVYSGDGSTTAFTLEHAVGSDEDILVSVDGVVQEPSVAYAVSGGTTLTFTSAPSNNAGNNIFVYYLFRTVATVDHPSTSSLLATDGTFSGGITGTTGTFSGDLTVDTSTLYVDSTNNNIGIGTTSPTAFANYTTVAINGTTGSVIDFEHGGTINSRLVGESGGLLIDGVGSRFIKFHTNSTERMRIDSSGNLLVGKTSADNGGTVGVELNTNDTAYFTRSGGAGVNINRTSTDGNIAVLQKDGTTIGVLGVNGGNNLFISSAIANHGGLIFSDGGASTPQMNPISSGSTLVDNAMNIGSPSYRFKNLYLGGTAQTSLINTGSSAGTLTLYGGSTNQGGKIVLDGGNNDGDIVFHTGQYTATPSARMNIFNNGNVTIGTTDQSPAEASNTGIRLGNNGASQFSSSGQATLQLNRTTSEGSIITFRDDGTEVGAISTFANTLQIGSYVGNDAFIQFVSSGIKPVNSAGTNRDNGIDLGASNARFKDLYLGGGAYIGGTSSANHLDDYEEGTWTPATSSASYNTGSSTGRYTKIGRIVVLHFSINFSAVNGGSNSNVVITGVPITPTSVIDFTGSVRENSNTGAIYVTRLGAGATVLTMNSMDNVTNGSQRTIRANENYGGTIVYMT